MATANPPIAEVFEVTSSAGFSRDLQQTLYTYQQQAHLTDFTIHVQDTQIHCHRVMLSAASPYFEAMLRASLEEAEKSEVNLDCLDEEILKDLIKYFYTGELKVQYNKLKGLVSACEFLQLQVLKSQLEGYIIRILHDENCIGWFKVAGTYGMDDLAEKATDRMLKHFTSVCRHNEFRQLSLAEVIDYISKKKMKIHSEDTVLDACIVWTNADFNDRKEHFKDIMRNISLQSCSAGHLVKASEENKELFGCTKLQDELSQAFKGIALSFEDSVLKTDDSDQICYFLCGGDLAQNQANKQVFVYVDGNWKHLCNLLMDGANLHASMCLLKGELIVTGGKSSRKLCCLFKFSSQSWHELPDLPSTRYGHSSHQVGKYIYILGGCFECGKRDNMTVDAFDTAQKTWDVKASMMHGVYYPISVQKHNIIFVIQNSNGGNSQTMKKHGITLQIYDTENDNWRYGASLTKLVSSTRGASAVVHKDDILLLGGEDQISLSYSIINDAWTLLTLQSKPKKLQLYGSAVVSDGKILVLGGSSNRTDPDNSQHDYVSEFELETGVWKKTDIRCPVAVSNHYVASVPAYYFMK